jgi:hypothetical protein
MSTPELDPATVHGLVARASDPQRDRWLQQVRRTGACRHPIRLRGVVRRGGELVYSTAGEPDGALMVRCGNRRAECCPSCAREYGGDMWQLIYAGLAGGRKGVPESVAEHPQVFATLTAPGFGAVHTRRDDGRRCRCGQHHPADDPMLGGAIDPGTYDYEGAVLWNWHAPALWNRFTTELVRVLAGTAELSEARCRRLVRVAYAKVAEFQARGLVHFHAIIRLDHPDDRAKGPGLRITADELAAAIHTAAKRTSVQGHGGGGDVLELRLGEQIHTKVLSDARDGEPLDPEAVAEALRPQAVAAYVAKYSCKGSHETITRPGAGPEQLREGGVPEQLVQMATAVLRLAERPGMEGMGRWVHMLGFRGHFVTKSRGYSTTLGELRQARADYRSEQDQTADDGIDDEDSTVVLSAWEYIGSGYLNPGDVLLAAGVEASLRAAREALLELRQRPPDSAR